MDGKESLILIEKYTDSLRGGLEPNEVDGVGKKMRNLFAWPKKIPPPRRQGGGRAAGQNEFLEAKDTHSTVQFLLHFNRFDSTTLVNIRELNMLL